MNADLDTRLRGPWIDSPPPPLNGLDNRHRRARQHRSAVRVTIAALFIVALGAAGVATLGHRSAKDTSVRTGAQQTQSRAAPEGLTYAVSASHSGGETFTIDLPQSALAASAAPVGARVSTDLEFRNKTADRLELQLPLWSQAHEGFVSDRPCDGPGQKPADCQEAPILVVVEPTSLALGPVFIRADVAGELSATTTYKWRRVSAKAWNDETITLHVNVAEGSPPPPGVTATTQPAP